MSSWKYTPQNVTRVPEDVALLTFLLYRAPEEEDKSQGNHQEQHPHRGGNPAAALCTLAFSHPFMQGQKVTQLWG